MRSTRSRPLLSGAAPSVTLSLRAALPLVAALALTASASAAPAAGLVAAPGLHDRPRLEPQLAFADDRLARLQAFFDDHVFVGFLPGHDRTLLDRRVGLHDEDVLALLAGLHCFARYDHRVRQRVEVQLDPAELPWPQLAVGVVECRLQLDGVGRRVDVVVDEGQLADR